MTDAPEPGPLHPPPPPELPRRRSSFAFAGGVLLAFFLAPTPAVFVGLLLSGSRLDAVWLPFVCELVVFGLFVWLARRKRWTGFPQGLVVGCALVFLLAAACWGVIAVQN